MQAGTLIRTKLSIPFIRPGLIPRRRLQERIAQGLCGPLALVVAPAGFGKTTLVASCVSQTGLPVAWLSLDKNDNQPWRFLTYLLAALQEADPMAGREASQLSAVSQQATPEIILTKLINDLSTDHLEIILVLDDYQFISNQEVHDQVAFLLEHHPKTFHMVIVTRSDPMLPLARLRAHGQTVELRAEDLRFTEPEAAQFLNQVMGLNLDSKAIAALEERTEGWVAGLQMAALSMRDRKDISRFIEGFSGTNRYILDYLLEEVLANQSPEIQRFLQYTSILERLTASLCDVVLAKDEKATGVAGAQVGNTGSLIARPSASILTYLDQANLFLVPLDDERCWYRYHHLFADLLRARLQQNSTVEEVATLHMRAAQWYEQNGLTYEAIHHASLTADQGWVERLIEQNYLEMFQHKDSPSFRLWTGELSKELIYKRPQLCIHEATRAAWFGQLEEADQYLNEAEKRLHEEASTPAARTILGHLAYVRSRVTGLRGDIPRAIELCQTARDSTPPSNQALLGGIGVMLGFAYFQNGDFSGAIQTLEETIQTGRTAGAIKSTVGTYCVLARLYTVLGQLHRAFELYQEADQYTLEAGKEILGLSGIINVGRADILYEWNDLEAALEQLKQGMETIPYWSKADDIAMAYATLARIHQAQGNLSAAEEAIHKGLQVVRTNGVFQETRDAIGTVEIRLRLAQRDGVTVAHLASCLEKRLKLGETFRYEDEQARITLARIRLAQNRLDESLGLLSRLETNAQAGGRTGRLIPIWILKALAMQKRGEYEQAQATLEKSLGMAEPEGYSRLFLDEGEPLRLILAWWLAHADASPLHGYAAHLLSRFEDEPDLVPTVLDKASQIDDLVEPLSGRELEVLQLLTTGKSNQEIAQQLMVSPGTIKSHTASIYRKLDVANRTEAIMRARRLGLLP